MQRPFANSGGHPVPVTLREYNTCHNPDDGRFCSTPGARSTTRVGITSSRSGKTPREVFRQMREFEGRLKALPGVTDISVRPGVGQWDGGWEPSWVVSYTGNGAARRLMAEVGKAYDQDAVLLMKPCRGPDCDSLADLTFARPVNKATMDALGPVMTEAGLGGWTWAREGGKTVLRTAAVPQWGTPRDAHLAAVRRLRGLLASRGFLTRQRLTSIKTEAIGREDYDAVIGGR